MIRLVIRTLFVVVVVFCVVIVVAYSTGVVDVRARIPLLQRTASHTSHTAGPCRLDAEGVPLFSPPGEPPCVRRYIFFNVDNRALDQDAVVNASFIPLIVAANLLYIRNAQKWIAANEEYKYFYFHSNVSCKTDALECDGPFDNATNKSVVLHPAWIALKVILHLLENEMQTGDVAISLDTDVLIKKHESLHAAFHTLPGFLNGSVPIALIHDGGFWKGFIAPTYSMDINSGIIMFVKTPACLDFFRALRDSILVQSPLEKVKKRDFHKVWPWMQERISWLSGEPRWRPSVVLLPLTDWRDVQPYCYGIYCHWVHRKLQTITAEVSQMYVSLLDCDEAGVSPFCSEREKPVVIQDWRGRDVELPFRTHRFEPSISNLWGLTRHILQTERGALQLFTI